MNRHLSRVPRSPAVLSLLVINIAIFVAQLIRNDVADSLLLRSDASLTERPWTLVTVMFLHEHVLHISLLAVVLVIFGVRLERLVGARHVMVIYLASGLLGSLAIVLTSAAFGWDERMVGSSAAFHGIIAAFVALRPETRLPGGTAKHWLIALLAINLLLLAPTGFGTPLSSVAHLVGLAAGYLYGRQLLSDHVAPAGNLV